MIEKGQCNVESCSNFYNPSWVFMDQNYWIDESIDEVDSDLILMIQWDSFLCHYLDPDNWRDVTFVGGVGPSKPSRPNPSPTEGICLFMPARWRSWTRKQRMWESQQQGKRGVENNNKVKNTKKKKRAIHLPAKMLNTSFPPVCDGGKMLVGKRFISP